MNQALANVKSVAPVETLTLDEAKQRRASLIGVLQNSLYPGAKAESVELVLNYCQHAGLDPMLKPVHIVPMNVKVKAKVDGQKDTWEWRDVIMPGIGLYRTQASESGQYVGNSEPVFGDDVTEEFEVGSNDEDPNPNAQRSVQKIKVTYPKWCSVTVYRMVAGEPRAFIGKEMWVENYATTSKNSRVPNAMWKKRP